MARTSGEVREIGEEGRREMTDALKALHYKQLKVWQKSMELAKKIYALTTNFPHEERFGLVSQMRDAAVSVPSNIAEGQAREGAREFLQFLSHADGSLAELETQLILGSMLGFCSKLEIASSLEDIDEIQRMLSAIRRRLALRENRSGAQRCA